MSVHQSPVCQHCSGTDWALECVVTSLVYGFSHDPEGPFKRESTVDRVRALLFYCEGCGEEPDPAAEAILAAAYRSHDPERFSHPAQGGLLAQVGTGDVVPRLVPAPVLSGPVGEPEAPWPGAR